MEVNCNIKKYTVCIPTTIRQWSERKEQHEAKTQIKSEAKNSSACRAKSTVQFPPFMPGLVEQLISRTLPCCVGIRNGNGTHTHCSETGQPCELIFPPKKATQKRARWFYCAAAEWNQNRQQQKEQTRSNWLLSTWWWCCWWWCCWWWWWSGGTEWGGLLDCWLAWLVPVADAPLKTPGTRHQVAVAVAVAGAFVRFSCCYRCVPEGCRTFSARRARWGLLAVNINFNCDSHHPFKAVRRYASWNQLANSKAKQQQRGFGLLCLCLTGKVWWSLWCFAYL